jgi:hypothetical protein
MILEVILKRLAHIIAIWHIYEKIGTYNENLAHISRKWVHKFSERKKIENFSQIEVILNDKWPSVLFKEENNTFLMILGVILERLAHIIAIWHIYEIIGTYNWKLAHKSSK